MVKASELLKDLGMGRVFGKDAVVRFLGSEELVISKSRSVPQRKVQGRTIGGTHILLLLVDVANLEPDIDLGQRPWRILQDVAEALRKARVRKKRHNAFAPGRTSRLCCDLRCCL